MIRGFIKDSQKCHIRSLLVVVILIGFSYAASSLGISLIKSNNFNNPRFSEGGPEQIEIDPILKKEIVWSIDSKSQSPEIESDALYAQGVLKQNNGSIQNTMRQYKVLKGDTLKKISAKFSITIETIRSANPQIKKEVKKGDVLGIPQVNGVVYSIKNGDTLDGLAEKFQVSADLVAQFNPEYREKFADVSGSIFIPYAKQSTQGMRVGEEKKESGMQLIVPAVGWNWGKGHKENAVDIANKCGTYVVASADGLVVKDEAITGEKDGWNSGYGNFVFIEHADGVKTRYAHLDSILVDVGDSVAKGQKIGTMGSSGNADDINGCHVHFEVLGAVNPFIVK